MIRARILLPALLATAFVAPSGAAVLDAAPAGFTVEHRATLPVSRQAAWQAVTRDVHAWWSADHTVSGDAGNLYINPVPMGCFCERLGEHGGLVHLAVTFVNPGVMLRMTGGLGPLGLMGVNGNLTIEFDDDPEAEGGSVVTLRYAVGGYREGGLDAVAGPVDAVLGEQLSRLAAYVSAEDAG